MPRNIAICPISALSTRLELPVAFIPILSLAVSENGAAQHVGPPCHGNANERAFESKARQVSCRRASISHLGGSFGSGDPQRLSEDEAALKAEHVNGMLACSLPTERDGV
jgi:hypothetical protein